MVSFTSVFRHRDLPGQTSFTYKYKTLSKATATENTDLVDFNIGGLFRGLYVRFHVANVNIYSSATATGSGAVAMDDGSKLWDLYELQVEADEVDAR